MSVIVRWLREKVLRQQSILLPAHLSVLGEASPIGFKDYIEAYLKDPLM